MLFQPRARSVTLPRVGHANHRGNAALPSDITDQRLGAYELRRVLGEGSVATVYEALDTKFHRRVALKVMRHAAFAPDVRQELHARFRQEGQIVAGLEHPGVLAIYDYGETPEAAYLAMNMSMG